jgi:hypothetical protein
MMKRLITPFLMLLIAVSLSAQQKSFFDKKEDLKDFTGKTTKVVLADDNSLLDLMLKDAISKNWFISPFEFLSKADFDKMKSDTNYYFLMRVNGKFSKESEPAMEFLTLLKGGPEAEKGLDAMPEILSIPLQAIDDTQGRVFTFLPAFVNIIQAHVLKVTRNVLSAYIGISAYSNLLDGVNDKKILFGESDFAFAVDQAKMESDFKGMAKLASEEEIDKALQEKTPATLVSLVIAPNINQKGSYCYKMLISTDSRELYLYRKHKMGGKNKKGFITEDYKRMSAPYAFKK